MCEEYREGMMALVDGELNPADRVSVECHLTQCPHCRTEYRNFLKLSRMTHRLHFAAPHAFSWHHYYHGVCRKLETRASYGSWSAVSLLLVVSGTLMFFGFSKNPLALLLGAMAMMSGTALLWLSYFCNCGKK